MYVVFARTCPYSEDFQGLSDAHVGGRHIMATVMFLLPPMSLSLCGFPLSFVFLLPPPMLRSIGGFPLLFLLLLLVPPAVSRIGPASKQA